MIQVLTDKELTQYSSVKWNPLQQLGLLTQTMSFWLGT